MKKWIKSNLRNIIVTAFVIPILLVAFVSISHVTTFYGISNPLSWAIYLSVAIEIAALAALAAVSVRMGKFVYVPFFIVTLIQFVGNLYFSFTFIDENSDAFKEWMNMVGSFFEMIGVDPTDPIAHKRILALISGGLLPIISLTFAHMLVVYSDRVDESKSEEKSVEIKNFTEEEIDKISKIAGKIEADNSELIQTPKYENLDKIEEYLKKINQQKFGEEIPVTNDDNQNAEDIDQETFKIEIPLDTQEENDLEIITPEVEFETYIPEELELPKIEEAVIPDIDNIITKPKPEQTEETKVVDEAPQIKRLVYSGRNG